MSYRDIYSALEEDLPKVRYRAEYMMPKIIKDLKQERNFPALRTVNYTVPESENPYIICFYAEFPINSLKPACSHFYHSVDENHRYLFRTCVGKYITPEGDVVNLKQVHSFSPHFLEQYNKRFHKSRSLSLEEIASIFMCRNKLLTPSRMNEKINRNYKSHGEFNTYAYEVRDGICFARTKLEKALDENGVFVKDDDGILAIIFTTYMNESGMSDEQLKAIEEEQNKMFNTIDELYFRNLINRTL